MAATDNIIYRLKPQVGDVSPHNELGGGDILTGGTIALVDTGAEGYAWRFTGVESAVVLGTTTFITGASDTGGKTMAVTLRRAANPTVSAQQMIGWTDTVKSSGILLKRGGGTPEAIGFYAVSTNSSAIFSSVIDASVTQTYVLKLDCSVTSLQDTIKVWVEAVGRAGDTPNLTGPGATLVDRTLNTLQINTANGGDYYIHDLVLWSDEKTDAECAALADNLRGVLDAPTGATATLALTMDAAVFAGIALVSPLTVLTAALADAVFAGSVGSGAATSLAVTTDDAIFSGTASVAGAVSLTLPALKNNTGTLLINQTGATAYVYATTGAHVVTKTAQTTNASGIMTITDALLVAATQYRVVVVLGSGAEGMDKVTAV